jgi:hypothetical protein
MKAIAVGSKVKYKREFLRSIGCMTGEMPHARGTVTALKPLSSETVLAAVDWSNPDVPCKVNTKNLTLVSDPEAM